MNYEVRNLTTGWSRVYGENGSYQATIFRNGKKVANVMEEGNGGPILYEWFDSDKPSVDISIHGDNGTTIIKGTPEEKVFREYADSLWDNDCRMYGDRLVADLVGKFEEIQFIKNAVKTKTVFRLKGDKVGLYRAVNGDKKDLVRAKYGDKVEEILNERFSSEEMPAIKKASVVKKLQGKDKSDESPIVAKGKSILDAAYDVLVEAGIPLGYMEITEKAISSGLYVTKSANPGISVNSAITKSIKTGDSRFGRTGRGVFIGIVGENNLRR